MDVKVKQKRMTNEWRSMDVWCVDEVEWGWIGVWITFRCQAMQIWSSIEDWGIQKVNDLNSMLRWKILKLYCSSGSQEHYYINIFSSTYLGTLIAANLLTYVFFLEGTSPSHWCFFSFELLGSSSGFWLEPSLSGYHLNNIYITLNQGSNYKQGLDRHRWVEVIFSDIKF